MNKYIEIETPHGGPSVRPRQEVAADVVTENSSARQPRGRRAWPIWFVIGVLVALSIGTALATPPNPFPYSIGPRLDVRTMTQIFRVNVTSTAATVTFTDGPGDVACTKAVMVIDEGGDSMRFIDDGRAQPTATSGILLTAGQTYSNPRMYTRTIGYIRAGSADISATIVGWSDSE